jgi:hypothetical protein
MYQDEIVEEIHRIREEYSRSFNHDLRAIFADLQKQQAESGRTLVDRSRQPSLTSRWSGRFQKTGDDAQSSSHRST